MKEILCLGGVAHGREVLDLGLKHARYSSGHPDLAQTHIEYHDEHGNKKLIRHVDGYTRYECDIDGEIHEVMLEDCERPEDIPLLLVQYYTSHTFDLHRKKMVPKKGPAPQPTPPTTDYDNLFG